VDFCFISLWFSLAVLSLCAGSLALADGYFTNWDTSVAATDKDSRLSISIVVLLLWNIDARQRRSANARSSAVFLECAGAFDAFDLLCRLDVSWIPSIIGGRAEELTVFMAN